MKRLAFLACIATLVVSCANETTDESAPAAAVESPSTDSVADSVAESTALPTPIVRAGLVSRDDVAISAPTVLWFWAPG